MLKNQCGGSLGLPSPHTHTTMLPSPSSPKRFLEFLFQKSLPSKSVPESSRKRTHARGVTCHGLLDCRRHFAVECGVLVFTWSGSFWTMTFARSSRRATPSSSYDWTTRPRTSSPHSLAKLISLSSRFTRSTSFGETMVLSGWSGRVSALDGIHVGCGYERRCTVDSCRIALGTRQRSCVSLVPCGAPLARSVNWTAQGMVTRVRNQTVWLIGVSSRTLFTASDLCLVPSLTILSK